MSFETVRAYEGFWRFIGPPDDLGDPTEGYSTDYLAGEDEAVLKGALAVSEAADRYFAAQPDKRVVTLLSILVDLPKPEGLDDPRTHSITLRKALGAIGFQVMKHGGNISSLERLRPRRVLPGELENPALTFERVIALHGAKARPQVTNPQGPGYATARRSLQPGSFMLGWCDPTNGRRCEVPVDVARIRHDFPRLRPKINLPLTGGPDV